MIRGIKLKRLQEKAINDGGGLLAYQKQFRDLLGITENQYGEPIIDHSKRALRPEEISISEVAREFLGPDWKTAIRNLAETRSYLRMKLQEADGHVVTASHFANISAFQDTIAGLIEAQVLDGYNAPEFIGDDFVTTVEARVNGGAAIGVANDGSEGEDLALGEPYPMSGLKETRVEIPDNVRRGTAIQVDEFAMIYDRTDQISERARNSGYATRRRKEISIAQMVQGITNTFEQDGVANNTYLSAAGVVPNDYINSAAITLEDWTDIDEAQQVLGGNTDPFTGFEIAIPKENLQILVSPPREMTTRHILNATQTWRNTATDTRRELGPNPLAPFKLYSSWIWYRAAIAAGSTAASISDWWMGDFKKAFQYRQVIPFQMFEANLSMEDQRKDIVAAWICREYGVAWVKNPRYTFQSNPA